jgi:hypothetical protein
MKFRAGLLQGIMMTNFRTAAMAIAVAAAMTSTQALADGALAPGKPAGLQQAQRHGHNLLLIGAAAAVVLAGVAVAVANSGNSSCSAANCPTSSAATGTSS